MKIAIIGSGYVGLVTGVCLADVGFEVVCVDIDKGKIEKLKRGELPIYEPGLEEMLQRNIEKGRLTFTTSLPEILDDVEVVFSAVGTPPDEDGSADLQYVLDVAHTVGRNINKYVLLITKSTVPVGTAQLVKEAVQQELDKRGVAIEFDVASNPEFLKEGDAISDFLRPDRIVVGVESARAKKLFEKIYKPFVLNGHPIIFTDIASAEMIKYAANAMLATRISFMNDIANLCEIVGADVNMVRRGIGSDSRIGNKFLYAGIGYGGSCFPKDVKALIKTADQHNYSLELLKSVEKINNRQKRVLFHKLSDYYHGKLTGKTVSLLGLAFKPNTDDMREAPSLVLIDLLEQAGCKIKVYDPVAMEEARRRVGDRVIYCADVYEALEDSDAMLLVTEWSEFRAINLPRINSLMRTPVIFDGRNIYDRAEMKKNKIAYFSIGRK
ncbi:MAG TPA: UDP-glucose/GDP-mannose dehydrogenase family protein [Bacteroidales bacterium]|jgi:UDPglucose 6-dehydrogenase|nr:UDP-glucose/GDP-mannose dehydrogenase family protein [Bacteroidales bacterium]HXK74288.1 UDP-glucose/GDP-mannose dehydrogenase family protein [Bacteroidales bacterium]